MGLNELQQAQLIESEDNLRFFMKTFDVQPAPVNEDKQDAFKLGFIHGFCTAESVKHEDSSLDGPYSKLVSKILAEFNLYEQI